MNFNLVWHWWASSMRPPSFMTFEYLFRFNILSFLLGFSNDLMCRGTFTFLPSRNLFQTTSFKKTPPWVFFLPLLVKFPKHGLLCDWSQWVVFVSFKQLHFSPPRSSILKESINNIVQRLSPPPSTSVCLPSWRHRLSVVFKFWLLFETLFVTP